MGRPAARIDRRVSSCVAFERGYGVTSFSRSTGAERDGGIFWQENKGYSKCPESEKAKDFLRPKLNISWAFLPTGRSAATLACQGSSKTAQLYLSLHRRVTTQKSYFNLNFIGVYSICCVRLRTTSTLQRRHAKCDRDTPLVEQRLVSDRVPPVVAHVLGLELWSERQEEEA